jgi:Fe-S cluster biogenesis protein NfuA
MTDYNKDQLYTRNVTLYLESNPNPNSLKFVANYMLAPEGFSFDFADKEAAKHSQLAAGLFNFDYVRRVFLMSNFVTVTKDENVDWSDIQGELKSFIQEYLESEKPVIEETARPSNEIAEDDPETVKKIKVILDEYVKPAVEQDGGAIIFDSFDDGIVKLQLQGSCSGCPSSTVTLKAGIENLLKSMMPEVQAVEAENI